MHSFETSAIIGCTLWGNDAIFGGGVARMLSGGLILERTIIAASVNGAALHGDADLACCDLLGNAGGDWVGEIADQLGTAGNIALDPLLCDPEAGDFHLRDDSPCAPDQSPWCGQIGAWEVSCGATPAVATRWGAIKARFR